MCFMVAKVFSVRGTGFLNINRDHITTEMKF